MDLISSNWKGRSKGSRTSGAIALVAADRESPERRILCSRFSRSKRFCGRDCFTLTNPNAIDRGDVQAQFCFGLDYCDSPGVLMNDR